MECGPDAIGKPGPPLVRCDVDLDPAAGDFAMNRILTIAMAVVAGSAAANAADMARPYIKAPAPVVAPVSNWTGPYVGLNVGGVWSKDDVTWGADPAVFGLGFTPV